jgi:hypothetical protein
MLEYWNNKYFGLDRILKKIKLEKDFLKETR